MKDVYYDDFDVDEVSDKIAGLMSRWSAHLIHIRGRKWKVYDYSDILVYEFEFSVDFNDIDVRVKLEDLKLNVIHHIESLRDDTTYIDELVLEELLELPVNFI